MFHTSQHVFLKLRVAPVSFDKMHFPLTASSTNKGNIVQRFPPTKCLIPYIIFDAGKKPPPNDEQRSPAGAFCRWPTKYSTKWEPEKHFIGVKHIRHSIGSQSRGCKCIYHRKISSKTSELRTDVQGQSCHHAHVSSRQPHHHTNHPSSSSWEEGQFGSA